MLKRNSTAEKNKKQGLPERKALLRQRLAIMRFTILSPAT